MIYRYFIELQYKGTHYHGWQFQPNAVTIQEVLNHAFSTVLREQISVTGCGRTDTGVHASYYVAHFDSEAERLEKNTALLFSINGILPKDIVVNTLTRVPADAHSRFDANRREYKYYIRHDKNPFRTEFSVFFPRVPDYNLMNEASQQLLGEKDFSCFCKSKSDTNTNICKVLDAFWKPNNTEYVFTIIADRFLRNMVRAIVGTLLDIGYNKSTIDDLSLILNTKKRALAGSSVPAHGLYLTDVRYDEHVFVRTINQQG